MLLDRERPMLLGRSLVRVEIQIVVLNSEDRGQRSRHVEPVTIYIVLEAGNADHRDHDRRQQSKRSAFVERQQINGTGPIQLSLQEMSDDEPGDHEEGGDAEAAWEHVDLGEVPRSLRRWRKCVGRLGCGSVDSWSRRGRNRRGKTSNWS